MATFPWREEGGGRLTAIDLFRRQLLGREAILASMQRAALSAADGDGAAPRCVFLHGEEGVGKTWLVRQLDEALRAAGRPHHVVHVDLSLADEETDLPFAEACARLGELLEEPVASVERVLRGLGSSEGPVALEIATTQVQLLLGARAALGGGVHDGVRLGAGDGARSRLGGEILLRTLERVGRLRPLLLVWSRAQLLKEPWLAFLREVVTRGARAGDRPFCVLCADLPPIGPEDPSAALALGRLHEALARKNLVRSHVLAPPDAGELRRALEACTPGASCPEELARDIHALTDGLPRRVEELLLALHRDGILEEPALAGWRLRAGRSLDRWSGAELLDRAVAAFVPEDWSAEHWETLCRLVLGCAAIFGERFPWNVVATALELNEEESDLVADFVDDHLEGPDRLVVELGANTADYPGLIVYRFDRPFARRAVERWGVGGTQGEEHGRALAAVLERWRPDADAALARKIAALWARAGEGERAAARWGSCQTLLSAEHLETWRGSLDLAYWGAPERARPLVDEFLSLLQRDEARGGKLSRRRAALSLVRDLAEAAAVPRLRGTIRFHEALAAQDDGRHEEAIDRFREARIAFGEDDDPNGEIQSAVAIGHLLTRLGRGPEAVAVLEDTLPTAEGVYGPSHPRTARVLASLGAAMSADGRHEDALVRLRRALDLHALTPLQPELHTAEVLTDTGYALRQLGRHDEALSHYEGAVGLSTTLLGGNHPETIVTRYNLGRQRIAMGDGDGLDVMRRAIEQLAVVVGPEHERVRRMRDTLAALGG